MNKPTLKTLVFNNKPIYYLEVDRVNYILVRPLCELLGVDAERQIKNLQEDDFLAPERSEQTVQVPGDSQSRQWICLPEEYIYGWIFGIKFSNTMSEETKENLIEYKRECYKALYNHFHGELESTLERIRIKAQLRTEYNKLQNGLLSNLDYQRMLQIERLLNDNKSEKVKTEKRYYELFEEEFRSRIENDKN